MQRRPSMPRACARRVDPANHRSRHRQSHCERPVRRSAPVRAIFTGARPLDANGPSFPVLVDPNGYMSALGRLKQWAPTNIPGVLSRRCQLRGHQGAAAQWFDLLDDITFDRDVAAPYQMGRPSVLGPSAIERDHRLTWAYTLQSRACPSRPSSIAASSSTRDASRASTNGSMTATPTAPCPGIPRSARRPTP